jgi:hypothetical protein
MSVIVWVVIAIVVIALIVAAVVAAMKQRSERLKGRFGPEYDRAVESQGGDRLAAERELSGRMSRRKKMEIVPLSEQSRQRYRGEWLQVQAQFVDTPAESLGAADALVERVMRERGYPMDDFDQRAADISVDHAGVVDHYRAAHDVSVATARGQSNTEDQRQAIVRYRALFEELLKTTDGRPPEIAHSEAAAVPSSAPSAPPSPSRGTSESNTGAA